MKEPLGSRKRTRGQFGYPQPDRGKPHYLQTDREPYQRELAFRASDMLPFSDSRAINDVIRTIMEGMNHIRNKSGSVVFPYSLSKQEEKGVRRFLGKYHGRLEARIEGFVPIRLEDGMGTEIFIREKMRRR